MAMVFRATIETPHDGRNFQNLDQMRKRLAALVHDLEEIAGKDNVLYEEFLTNVRQKGEPK